MLLRAPAGISFEQNANDRMFDISTDGRRFLLSTTLSGGDQSGALMIVENFLTQLRTALAAERGQ